MNNSNKPLNSEQKKKKNNPEETKKENIFFTYILPRISPYIFPVIKWVSFISFVYASWEYGHWLTNSKAIVSSWLDYSFTLFGHPFIILFFLLLGTLPPNVLRDYLQELIGNSGILVREWIYTFCYWARLICAGVLTIITLLIFRFINNNATSGDCSHVFTCADVFTSTNVNAYYLFLSLYLIIMLLRFFFCNLPPTNPIPYSETGIIILQENDVGLYGLQPSQCALINTIGIDTQFQLIPSNYRPFKGYRFYKNRRERWYVITENTFCLDNDLQLNFGIWETVCSCQVQIGNRYAIDIHKINLSVLESLEQLRTKIERDCLIKFRQKITSEFLYKLANEKLDCFYNIKGQKRKTPEAISNLIGELSSLLDNIAELGYQLINNSSETLYLYGKMFEVNLQIKNIKISQNKKTETHSFLALLGQESQQMNDKIRLAIQLIEKCESYIPPEIMEKIIHLILESLGLSDEKINELKKEINSQKTANIYNKTDKNNYHYYDVKI